jgi:hypothetical protein
MTSRSLTPQVKDVECGPDEPLGPLITLSPLVTFDYFDQHMGDPRDIPGAHEPLVADDIDNGQEVSQTDDQIKLINNELRQLLLS